MDNIPKIFFSYWDNSSLTYLQFLTVKSFQELNPNWKIIIYVPKIKYDNITWKSTHQKIRHEHKNYLDDLYKLDIEKIEIDFEEIGFYNNISEVHKSDYLRYYMLAKHGGLWSDMDILYIKPIDEVFNKFNSVNTALSFFSGYYSIGMLMSSPNNDFFKHLTNSCKKYFDRTQYQCIGSPMIRKLYPSASSISKKHKNINLLVLHNKYYLPFAYNKIEDIFVNNKSNQINNDTVGIHWFNGSSLSKNYQNLLENNSLPKTGSIYKYIQKYL